MPDEPNIDAVGAPVVEGIPEVQPTFPTIADLIPAAARRYIYALLPVMLIVVAVFDLPGAIDKVALILNAAGFGMALSNVPVTKS